MKVKMILPALKEAESPFRRPIKDSLFPPLGLATLAAYLWPEEIDLQDQHVEKVNLDDTPDLVVDAGKTKHPPKGGKPLLRLLHLQNFFSIK